MLAKQGQIQEAGYEEQAASYRNMAKAADIAIQVDKVAAEGSWITGAIKGVAAIASIATGIPFGSLTGAIPGQNVPIPAGQEST